MSSFHKQLGRRIRIARETKNISQEDLAAKSHLSTNQIGRIERAERSPNLKSLLSICDGLGISLPDLISDISSGNRDSESRDMISKIIYLLQGQDVRKLELFLNIADKIVKYSE